MPVATRTAIEHHTSAHATFARRLAACRHGWLTPVVEVAHGSGRVHVGCQVLDVAGDRTADIRLTVDADPRVAWIGDLHVQPSRRLEGIGTALAAAAEEFAQAHLAEAIGVFPLTGSLRFWRRMGYEAHPRRSRVLFKVLPPLLATPTGR